MTIRPTDSLGSLGLDGQSAETLATARVERFRAEARLEDGVDAGGEAFETYFATMLVKELRSTLPNGFFSGAGSDVYGAWFDEHIGKSLAERNALGFAGMIRASMARGEIIGSEQEREDGGLEGAEPAREAPAASEPREDEHRGTAATEATR